MIDKSMREFSVTTYGKLEKFNDTISKTRCRIFYKGKNRNGTYITDEFAQKLLSSIAYAPIKGIYDEENEDFTDHGEKRSEGRIYGIVPAQPNLAWEDHKDEDGKIRTYACVDVLVYTAIYENEAESILGKSQSMELYEKSIQGELKVVDGSRYFVFTEGCFLGLQVLGDEIEPCFEGASFFSLNELRELAEKINECVDNFQKGGQELMPELNFKLSDQKKCCALWDLLNPDFAQKGEVCYNICDIYDDYAVCYNYADQCYERVYYKKDDTKDCVEICERKRCFIIDVTEDEKMALEALHAINNNSFEKVDENFTLLSEKNSENESKIVELEASNATLTTERDESNANYTAAKEQLDAANAMVAELSEYKVAKETAEKQALISKYEKKLSEEALKKYSEKLADYSFVDLEKDLALELVNSTPSIFALEDSEPAYAPKDDEAKGGIEEILSRYKNKTK